METSPLNGVSGEAIKIETVFASFLTLTASNDDDDDIKVD